MSKVLIVTDSTSDIPQQVREKWQIEMVPLKVHIGDETYLDNVSITPSGFYEKLSQTTQLPTTSQPSPVDFMNVYKQLMEDDPEVDIISVHLSSAFSGTYQSAELAKSLLEKKSNITVLDSKCASYGLGMTVVAMAEAAAQGKSKQECLQIFEYYREQRSLYFLVDTLEFLQKGGRIGKASAMVGSLLNIKPILSIDESGSVIPVDKVRGQKKAMSRIVELLKQDLGGQKLRVAVAHANALETVNQLVEMIREQFEIEALTYTEIGPVIGTHAGPGTIAVFAIPEA